MKLRIIKDGQNRIVGQLAEHTNVTFVRDPLGRPKGQYRKSADRTYDATGKYFGEGDQTMRLLK